MSRPRVLLSAFACEPGRGSEPGAGWRWAVAAARVADVRLLTERENEPSMREALARVPVPGLSVEYVDVPGWVARRSSGDHLIRMRNAAWQRAVHRAVSARAEQLRPDVVHHLTWSSDWQPAGLPRLPGAGYVWGPVGGTAPLPWQLAGWFDRRGLADEVVRSVTGVVGRRLFGDPAAARADVVLCLNDAVASRFRPRTTGQVLLEPNVALDRDELTALPPTARDPRTAVFVGRLQDWKGVRLAVATLRQPAAAGWQLRVVGDGPALDRSRAFAVELGLQDRVHFLGAQPRQRALQELVGAAALLQPSMHDSCGWAVAEALALGTPAVVLDVGGPPLLLQRAGPAAGVAVPVSRDPTPALAAGLGSVRPWAGTRAFDADRLPALLADVYARASRQGGR